jgi:hypothetical protein
MVSTTVFKPIATVTIEPIGSRTATPREHSINVMLKLSASSPKYADKGLVATVAGKALAGFAPAHGEPDRRRVGDVTVTAKAGKAGIVSNVIGVEGTAVWPERPGEDTVDNLRDALLREGYRVAVREKRECGEPSCKVFVMLDWNRPSEMPSGWHTNLVCGAHNYRTCTQCKSMYVLSSTNAAGQAPSVHCEVCGLVMIEWGSSKVWTAELVTRGLDTLKRQSRTRRAGH